MKEVDIFKDLLLYKSSNQVFYNQSLLDIRNPEARQLFIQLREDEMRGIISLEQKINRIEASSGIISKIFPIEQNSWLKREL